MSETRLHSNLPTGERQSSTVRQGALDTQKVFPMSTCISGVIFWASSSSGPAAAAPWSTTIARPTTAILMFQASLECSIAIFSTWANGRRSPLGPRGISLLRPTYSFGHQFARYSKGNGVSSQDQNNAPVPRKISHRCKDMAKPHRRKHPNCASGVCNRRSDYARAHLKPRRRPTRSSRWPTSRPGSGPAWS